MTDERHTAVGRQYIPCDTFEQFTQSQLGKAIEDFVYMVDMDDVLTVISVRDRAVVKPYQYLYIYDYDLFYVKDEADIAEHTV